MLQRSKKRNGDLPLSSITIEVFGVLSLICIPRLAMPFIVKLQSSAVLCQSVICSGISLLKFRKSDKKVKSSAAGLSTVTLSLCRDVIDWLLLPLSGIGSPFG